MIDRILYQVRLSSLSLVELPRPIKRAVVTLVDTCLCLISVWAAFYLRLDEFVEVERLIYPTAISLGIMVPVFWINGLYAAVFRYSGGPVILRVTQAMCLYGLVFVTLVVIVGVEGTPRTIGIIQPLLLFIGVCCSRIFAKYWLGSGLLSRNEQRSIPRVLIYGAGSAGRDLCNILMHGNQMSLVGFIDDQLSLQGRVLNGFKIYAPEKLQYLIDSKRVSQVLLAIPSISRKRRRQIIDRLSRPRLTVRALPSVSEIAGGKISVQDIKELDHDDLLGREPVSPNESLLLEKVKNKTVMVTGAGGSIGSELCKQIMRLQPKLLVLIDVSEFGLYVIHNEVDAMKSRVQNGSGIKIVPLICSVQDPVRVQAIVSTLKPDTIYHAAAYKHVSIVEHNFAEGVKNNVFGVLTVCNAAVSAGVGDFVLISTDKAVRPTNVMGATKRLAEMILQALAAEKSVQTRFTMVRFGNVLASSGSVIPKFRDQIKAGGPVTVTHPEVTRFFMTIPEAAQLVIQASALGVGGDVLVLDMGQPVKIVDLARRMIQLSGLTVKDESNLDGDIEIEVTGLRPGEKLYEELLIGDNPKQTRHPKIMKANEKFISWDSLEPELLVIKELVQKDDVIAGIEILRRLVPEFLPESRPVDRLYLEKNTRTA